MPTTTLELTPAAVQALAVSAPQDRLDMENMISHFVINFLLAGSSRVPNAALYEQDFFQWTQATAALLRAGKWHDVDRDTIAEELESLGKRDRRELENRLAVLLRHLLKWRYQPGERSVSRSWPSTIREQRRRLARLLRQSPSLRPLLTEALLEEYRHARLRASDETGLPEQTFPETCPWTVEQALDDDFWPHEIP